MINGRTCLHVVANGTMTGQRYIDEVLLPHVRLFRGAVNLNPIENVWDTLGRQVAGRNYPPTNKNTLIRALTEEWDKLPQQLLDNAVQSMPIQNSAKILLDVGEGKCPEVNSIHDFELPTSLCQVVVDAETLIDSIYYDVHDLSIKEDSWLCERLILAPINDQVTAFNQRILKVTTKDDRCPKKLLPTLSHLFYAADNKIGPLAGAPPDFVCGSSALRLNRDSSLKIKVGKNPVDTPYDVSGKRLSGLRPPQANFGQSSLMVSLDGTGCLEGSGVESMLATLLVPK
ncbi:ATP-dependent DNA helicase [Trichonephila clavipes]|nr:ATP-dependent DNA helicase [Trichonephila clavipes]